MKKLMLFAILAIYLIPLNSKAQRWYSYDQYLNNVTTVGYNLFNIWNDTTAIFGYGGITPVYQGTRFTSVGQSFAPILSAWNDPTLYGSTIRVGPTDAYTIDSVRIYGKYLRNNLRTAPKDTLRLSFVYGNGSTTTNLQQYSFTGPSFLTDYGYSPLYWLAMDHDSLHNRAGNFAGVATLPYVQDIILSSTDTATFYNKAIQLTTPYAVPAGNSAGMSLTFKSGDASFTALDTVIYTSGSLCKGLSEAVNAPMVAGP